MKKNTETINQLKERVREIRELNLLPKNYAVEIAKKLGVSRNVVYKTVSGTNSNLDVIELVLEIADSNREKQLLDKANKILEK